SSRVDAVTSERAITRLGTVLQQKYRITRLIGIGGTAAVYAATHRNGHRVAIKFLLERFLDEPGVGPFFHREAYAANRVEHPGVVPVLDDDLDEHGCPFLVMPLLEGESLRARWSHANHRLPVPEVCVFMAEVLDVLASAHAKGVVHRDIKPENLFITHGGEVRVLDFGIAQHLDGEGTTSFAGQMIGTPAFMPPEQARGELQAIGPRSDIWAVGATIFALLSGEYVRSGDTPGAQLAAAATQPARSLGEVGSGFAPAIVRVVDRALAFDPADRWDTAAEMRGALVAALEEALGAPFATVAAHIREELVTAAPRSSDDARSDDKHAEKTQPAERRRRQDTPADRIMEVYGPARNERIEPTLLSGSVAPVGLARTPLPRRISVRLASTLLCEYVEGVWLQIIGREAPSDEDWDRNLYGFTERAIDGRLLGILACSDGGIPTTLQRQRCRSLAHNWMTTPVAVLTSSSASRGAATALRWFHSDVVILAREEIREALDYLVVPLYSREKVVQRFNALRATMRN
ncbi:MAG TPA: serine/threonine-protein kinase, partial [Polyangiaceae bacterium]|nr:serine/threonine-protein kinase [Polyangiaceae bacterium]